VYDRLFLKQYGASPWFSTHVPTLEQFEKEGIHWQRTRIYKLRHVVNAVPDCRWHNFTLLLCRDLYPGTVELEAWSCQTVKMASSFPTVDFLSCGGTCAVVTFLARQIVWRMYYSQLSKFTLLYCHSFVNSSVSLLNISLSTLSELMYVVIFWTCVIVKAMDSCDRFFFPHSLQADVRLVLQIRPLLLNSSSLPVHYSLISLSFITVYSCYLSAFKKKASLDIVIATRNVCEMECLLFWGYADSSCCSQALCALCIHVLKT
jgi:hypothetical protein